MAIAQKANSDFKQRDTLQQSQFKQEYQEYWQKREDTDAESQINSNTLKTVVNLSQMTTTSVMDKAAELHHIEASQNKDDGISPVDDCDSRNDNSSINEDTSDNSFTEELYSIVEKSNEFASDHIGGVLRWAIGNTDHILKAMHCVKLYANALYFGKLCECRDSMIRNVITSFVVPIT
ncbi:hypothetical protein HPULCUR_002375 [Helicostylum pulchrum]|uniref:Uncharacterized protein n=1 Tax=Helicostylum pulchrum TaxID=562976 RepID=A0ABP9XQF3_9FUNG